VITESAEYYSCKDVDHLNCDDVDSAVEEYLDEWDPEEWPQELTAMGYVESSEHPEPVDGEQLYERDEQHDVVVHVATWVREHAEHWLKDPAVAEWVLNAEPPDTPPCCVCNASVEATRWQPAEVLCKECAKEHT
jgi:hypothetical protein